jgi:LEA14-like dessication related protein
VGIESINVSSLGMNESVLEINLTYFNPNNFQAKLKDASGNTWLDGKLLGQFRVDSLTQIPANANFRLPITLQVDMKSFLNSSLLTLLKKDVVVKIEGNAKIGKAGIFINFPIKSEWNQNLAELLQESKKQTTPN